MILKYIATIIFVLLILKDVSLYFIFNLNKERNKNYSYDDRKELLRGVFENEGSIFFSNVGKVFLSKYFDIIMYILFSSIVVSLMFFTV